ncbi:hypothetical protein LshimejAT787_0502450 [Lyophyllum shimeji]|uniref:Uncharacterized protein n=1 Tax=Lyophyllum shimeji TaxID=47721 RepID=A0A9P3UNX8_LYOSH|nr:hypothetical protein LshimejAT787_0502450 [Lyophyllum shimeji]
MPGSSAITAVVPVSNRRNIFPHASRLFTYDAEVYIGDDKVGQRQYVKSVVHHHVPPSEKEPEEKSLCFISGKIASIEPNTFFGKGHRAEDYDLEIDAFVFYKMPDCASSSPAVVTISGLTGQQVNSNEFYFHVTQYIVHESKTAAHRVHIPESGRLSHVVVQTALASRGSGISVPHWGYMSTWFGSRQSPSWKTWKTSVPPAASGNQGKSSQSSASTS